MNNEEIVRDIARTIDEFSDLMLDKYGDHYLQIKPVLEILSTYIRNNPFVADCVDNVEEAATSLEAKNE